jgi:hypothetical protein
LVAPEGTTKEVLYCVQVVESVTADGQELAHAFTELKLSEAVAVLIMGVNVGDPEFALAQKLIVAV